MLIPQSVHEINKHQNVTKQYHCHEDFLIRHKRKSEILH